MKVLMICTEKLPVPPIRGGAIQTYISGIVDQLATQHDLTILGITDPQLPKSETVKKVRYVRVAGLDLNVYLKGILTFLKNNSFDLIHIFNRPRLVNPIRQIAPKARIILSMHNDMFGQDKISPQEAAAAIDHVEKIVTVSDYVGKTICQHYPQAKPKVQTIYSGVDLKLFVPYSQSKQAKLIRQKIRKKHRLESKKVILFIGRLSPKKGADVLVRAMWDVAKKHRNAALVIVGGSWYSKDKVSDYIAYIRSLAKRSPIPIITTGYVPADQIHHWFWAGDLFVCTSQWEEPLARVHYEAMAAGLPFITTARGGNPEVVMNGNGLIVKKPDDPKEFAQKINKILSDKREAERMGRSGRKLVEGRFSWKRVAKDVLGVWQKRTSDEKVNE